MLRFIFDSFAIKFIIISGVILILLINIGNSIDDKPIRNDPWLPAINYEKKRTKSTKANRYYYREEPWRNDRKEQTENWADFLEELDNRGYSVFDPEAEDIWEEFY